MVLGAALQSLPEARRVVERLDAADFTSYGCRAVFAALVALLSRGAPVDAALALNELRQVGQMSLTPEESAGPFIHRLIAECPMPEWAPFHIEVLIEESTRRRIAQAGATLSQAAATAPLETLRRLAVDELAEVAAAIRRARPSDADVEAVA